MYDRKILFVCPQLHVKYLVRMISNFLLLGLVKYYLSHNDYTMCLKFRRSVSKTALAKETKCVYFYRMNLSSRQVPYYFCFCIIVAFKWNFIA